MLAHLVLFQASGLGVADEVEGWVGLEGLVGGGRADHAHGSDGDDDDLGEDSHCWCCLFCEGQVSMDK